MMTEPLYATFADPPREFGVVPFWFWNDDLTEHELLRQLHEFHAKGCGGVLIHPRTGLARRIGYLTDKYFRLVRVVVEEAARLDMLVILYDEGSYPSGSAQGRVVADNPAHAARCLIMKQQTVQGPARGFWHPNPGRALNDELICVVLARETAPDVLDPESLTLLDIHPPELVQYDVPEGHWRLLAFWHVYSGGTIRGVYAEEEDQHATAPAAGDILNADAVASFLRHTHEQYAKHLHDHFGSTVVALFTDEPMPLGRGVKRGPKPWPFTPGFLDDVQQGWHGNVRSDVIRPDDIRRWLPALWLDCGPQTEDFRQHYTRAVHKRLERVFYAAQSTWCAAHGLALTGHPAESNDFGALRQFHWPGQDMVWRWVTPGSASALEGPHSCAPKCASSAAILQGSRRNVTEVLGAYGWQLTLDEAKWLIDWHLVRGCNLIIPHAFFYSLRGRRAYESEPDVGLHNVWWPDFRLLGDYVRRLCWLLSDGALVCAVAILTYGNAAAWSVAKLLQQCQIDYLLIDEEALAQATIEDGLLCIGPQRFRAVICDPPTAVDHRVLAEFAASGSLLLAEWQPQTLVDTVVQALGRDLDWPNAPDLRVLHYVKAGRDFYFLVNEGEFPIEGSLSLRTDGALERWDPLTGDVRSWPTQQRNGRTYTSLRLERRHGIILAVDAQRTPDPTIVSPPTPNRDLFNLNGPWQAFDEDGTPLDLPCPGDWAQVVGWELFVGHISFQSLFVLPDTLADGALFLDLGAVGDIAELFLNGVSLGVCAWRPYVWRIDGAAQVGENQVKVRVTNSIANRFEGLQRPSGILGPVVVRRGYVVA